MTESELYKYIVEKASSYGMKSKNDPNDTQNLVKMESEIKKVGIL